MSNCLPNHTLSLVAFWNKLIKNSLCFCEVSLSRSEVDSTGFFDFSLTDNFDPDCNKRYNILSYSVCKYSKNLNQEVLKFPFIGCFINFQKLKNRIHSPAFVPASSTEIENVVQVPHHRGHIYNQNWPH
jgi:hypothetical protein